MNHASIKPYGTIMAYARSRAELGRILAFIRQLPGLSDSTHINGVYSIPSPLVYADPNGFIDPGVFEMHDKHHKELSEELRTLFFENLAALPVTSEYTVVRAKGGVAVEGVLEITSGADLIISGQLDPDDADVVADSTDRLAFESGRSVILVPRHFEGATKSFERVVIAFNGKKEGTRAAYDALPLLEQAANVDILWIDPPESDEDAHRPGLFLEKALRHRKINAKAVTLISGRQSVQEVLADYIKDNQADMLVMGAYSRSRLSELIFGGLTRSILSDAMPVPTLFSR